MAAHVEAAPRPRAAVSVARFFPRPGLFPFAVVGTLLFLGVPHLLVQDGWLTLVSGREIVRHGLPSQNHLTLLGNGRHWVDQQWLAQLLFYGVNVLAGLKGVVLAQIVACFAGIGLLIQSARRRGASPGSVAVIAAVAIAAAPWGLQVRAQGLAILLFGATLALLLKDQRAESWRTLFVLPVLCLWANVHGSVVLGAALVSLCGAFSLSRRGERSSRHVARAAALMLLPPLTLLASPYGFALAGYYRLMLINPPFKGQNVEWKQTAPSAVTAIFFGLACLAIYVGIRNRSWFSRFEIATMLLTLLSALLAVRGIIWFSLASVAILPAALRRSGKPRLSTRGATLSTIGAAVVCALAVAQFAGMRSQELDPFAPDLATAVAHAAGSSGTVFADDQHADWLLWKVPSLRGRVAYDVRFELLRKDEIRRLADYVQLRDRHPIAGKYTVVVVDRRHADQLKKLGAMKVRYADDDAIVVSATSGVQRPIAGGSR